MGECDQGEIGPVKITDLAWRLGIDKSTVSRALNKRPGVAAKTRERISRVAREMGYSPNVHGQQLRGGKSTTLGLVLGTNVENFEPHFFGPFPRQVYRAAADVAEIARAAGIENPADLSLTGFDDVDSRLVESLQLTTIHVSQAVQAEIAIDIILNHDPGRTERLEHRVATDLIVRTLTAPPSLQSPPGTVLLP